jgi:type VI secretion system protein ImpA
MIDPALFTSPLADADPSGPNLEYDPDFQALERAQQGRPEQVIGDSVKPGEEPDWPNVRERAEALLMRARDLRVVMALSKALLHTDGFPGLAAGLTIMARLLETQWDSVHPQLDAEDGNDPTLRINTLMALASTDGLLQALRATPVLHSKTLGRFSLRDIRIAAGKSPAPAHMAEAPQQVQVDAAFRDADLSGLELTAAAVNAAAEQVGIIDRILLDKVGSRAPELKPLILDLADLSRLFAEKLKLRGASAPGDGASAGGDGAAAGTVAGVVGEVTSREDVVRQIDRLCEYYRRHEPSSPVPLLLQRAKRLVSKDFMDIIRDLTPAGVAEAELIAGTEKRSE